MGSGCDGGASKRDSYYQRLVGTWTVERLYVRGREQTRLLNERYSALRIEFQSGREGRAYEILGTREDTAQLAQGRIELLSAEVLRMLPGGELERAVTWEFEFETSRATLRIPGDRRAGSEEFLTMLLPGGSWGDVQSVEIELAPDE